ncbi:hypothetical protein SCACP_12070 [Sporomusa carbonis]|uniref:hypothetical protein n=1 Tax=Sporomusa carbonis TaxID=3076075 RepID=UPI003A602643
MKKLLLLTFVFMFAFNTVSFAAVSGSKPKMSSPVSKPPTTQTAPSKGTSSEYKPSAPASSYSEKAPAAAAKPANQQTVQQPNTGGFLRNFGLFGGGMLLGSMLGGLFGFGNTGMFASIMGMLFNIILLAGVFMAGRYLWNKFKNRDNMQR